MHKEALGADFEPYLNHCLRVYFYTRTLLLQKENRKLAIAIAFHDLDIWSGKSMAYLDGSSEMAVDYLQKNELSYLPDEMRFIISNHHKLTKIKGNIEAEALRKADLIDLTAGFIHFNLPLQLVAHIEVDYPRLGFTGLMTRKLLKYAIGHPMKPFPMLKW